MALTIKSSSNLYPIFFYLICAVVLFGVVGNVSFFVSFYKKNRKVRFNILMLTLAIFDSIFLLTSLPLDVINFQKGILWSDTYHHKLGRQQVLLNVYKTLDFISLLSFGGSVFTALTISLERYLLICRNK